MMENPAVPPHPNNSRNLCGAVCRIYIFFVVVVGFFVYLGIFFFIVWYVFSSDGPQFRVDSFSLSNFTLVRNDSSSAISVAAQVQLTARNPNKFVALSFGRTDANVYYRSSPSPGPTTKFPPSVFPPFSLGRKSRAPLTASFAAVVETGGSNGNVTYFDVRLSSSVRYKEGVVGRRRNHALMVFCEGLVVGIPSDDHNGRRRPGGLIGGAPRPCGVICE